MSCSYRNCAARRRSASRVRHAVWVEDWSSRSGEAGSRRAETFAIRLAYDCAACFKNAGNDGGVLRGHIAIEDCCADGERSSGHRNEVFTAIL